MKIYVEMDIPITPRHCPVVFLMHINQSFSAFIWKKIYKYVQHISHWCPCPRQNNMDLCCLANNFNKKLLISDRAASLWVRSPRPRGSKSLMSSTAGFIGANLVNKGLARMLQALSLIQPHQTAGLKTNIQSKQQSTFSQNVLVKARSLLCCACSTL